MMNLKVKVTILFLILFEFKAISQSPVHVEAFSQGQGILRGRESECFVLAPLHVIQDPVNIKVTGIQGRKIRGRLTGQSRALDLALIELDNSFPNCEDWMISTISLAQRNEIVELRLRRSTGTEVQMPVKIVDVNNGYYYIQSTNELQLGPAMSGSALFSSSGKLLGMLDSVRVKNRVGVVLGIETILHQIDSVFTDITGLSIRAAEDTLARALAERNSAEMGQDLAIKRLVRAGRTFRSYDFSGVNLSNTYIAGGEFQQSTFHLTNMDSVEGRGVQLTQSNFQFATMRNGNLERVIMPSSEGYFIRGENAIFTNADLRYSYFYGCDFRNVDFSQADLEGAFFSFCDLRGATFDGAKLKGTGFFTSLLENASFEDAYMDGVNVKGSVASKFEFTTEQATTLCRYEMNQREERLQQSRIHLRVDVREEVPTGNSRRPTRMSDFIYKENYYSLPNGSLSFCPSSSNEPYNLHRSDGWESFLFDASLIRKAGRKGYIRNQVDQFFATFDQELRSQRTYQDNSYIEILNSTIDKAIKVLKPKGTPLLTDDLLILMLMNKGFIEPDEVNWSFYATEYLKIKSENFGWPKILPYGGSLAEIPDAWEQKYREWSIARAKNPIKDIRVKLFTFPPRALTPNDPFLRVTFSEAKSRYPISFPKDLERKAVVNTTGLNGLNGIYLETDYPSLYQDAYLVLPEYISAIKFPNDPKFEKASNFEVAYDIHAFRFVEMDDERKYALFEAEPKSLWYENLRGEWEEIQEIGFEYEVDGQLIDRNQYLSLKKETQAKTKTKIKRGNYITPDYGLLAYLATEVISPDNVHWSSAANSYYQMEQELASKRLKSFAPDWKPFFPETLNFRKIPEEWINLFKDWTLKRAEIGATDYFMKLSSNNLTRPFNSTNINVRISNFVTYWKHDYQELFEVANANLEFARFYDSYSVSPIDRNKSYAAIIIYIYPDSKNTITFDASTVPINTPIRSMDIRLRHEITKMQSYWYKEKNVILMYINPTHILYKTPQTDWMVDGNITLSN